MLTNTPSHQELLAELEALRLKEQEQALLLSELNNQLEEATDTLDAIRTGEVDALVVNGEDGHQVYTLKSADHTYRIFIEQMIQGAVTINEDGLILYCNSQFAQLLRRPLEKVIGQDFCQYVLPADLALCHELIASAWANINTKGEVRLSNAEEELSVLLSLKILNLDEGLALSIIVTDLTEQKTSQQLLVNKNEALLKAEQLASKLNANLETAVKTRTQELYKSQQQLSRILETMAEGVVIVDVNSKITYANKMAQEFLNLQESDYALGPQHDLKWQTFKLDGEPLLAQENPLTVAMRLGKPVFDFEVGVKLPEKDLLYISVNAVPIFNEDEQISGGIGTFVDVTHRRIAMQQKDDFISVASHELKTPITSLKVAIQLLLKIKDNPGAQLPKLIEQANKSMNKVSNLIEELLNASQITSGQIHVNLKQFNLAELIEECLLNLSEADRKKIKIEGAVSQVVHGDPNRVEQVLVNFINNAIKYAPNSPAIAVSLTKVEGFAKVTVTDQGPGISPSKLPHLFDRYYRVDDGGAQYSGLGLGLYICAEIIKKHKGQIGATSDLGKGSTFWFTLPLA